MTATSKTIVFFGNERLVSGLKTTDAPILRGLIAEGYHIAAVVSHHTDGISRSNRKLEVAEIAHSHNIPLLLPDKPSAIIDELKKYSAIAAVLVAYGRIIPQSVIDIFPKGIINIHPSLLPKYRGPTPIETVIKNGDTETGVSIMQLTAGMDEGPVYAQLSIPLRGNETKMALYTEIAHKSAKLLLQSLPGILAGTLRPVPQDNSAATYSHLLKKEEALLDTKKMSASEAERTIRAYLGFPKSKLTINGHLVVVTKAHVSHTQKTPLDIICRDGAFVTVDELVAPSGRHMTGEAFLRGYAAA